MNKPSTRANLFFLQKPCVCLFNLLKLLFLARQLVLYMFCDGRKSLFLFFFFSFFHKQILRVVDMEVSLFDEACISQCDVQVGICLAGNSRCQIVLAELGLIC